MNDMTEPVRERLSSRLGFILLSAGCAIGIGNVWRFPYVAGKSGGGWFVAIYLVCLALIGVPVLMMEFASGRAAQRSIAKLHERLTPDKRAWRWHGILGTCGLFILMMFYTTVTAWMIIYFFKTLTGSFAGMTPDQVGAAFGGPKGVLNEPWTLVYTMLGVCFACVLVCAAGVQKGLERVTKWLMLCLLCLIIILAVHSLVLPGAMEGVKYYLVPNVANVKAVGGWGVVFVEAMNHAFFTLSLGIGSMAIFGSYIGKDHSLAGEAINVSVLDTFVALCAGMIIIPACFAFPGSMGGMAQAQTGGPSLVFVTLPNVFNQMAGGRWWGAMFFLFMSCAALTTVLAVFEGIIASVREYMGWSRAEACGLLAIAVPYLSLPCIFGFNVWAGFEPFGKGSCVLDLEDFLVSDLALPIGGLAFAIYCCHKCGWGWKNFVAEVNEGKGLKLSNATFTKVFRFYAQWILPVFVAGIICLAIAKRFFGVQVGV